MSELTAVAMLYLALPVLGVLVAMCLYIRCADRGWFDAKPRRMAEKVRR